MIDMTMAPNGVDLSKLSLMKVKFHEDMSEETACFSGLLVEDGIIVAHVSNTGQGGCNDYRPFERAINNIDLYGRYGQLDVDCHIMQLAEEWNVATMNQAKGLVIAKGENIQVVTFGNKTPMSRIKKLPNYQTWIKGKLVKYEADGYRVLNRNL